MHADLFPYSGKVFPGRYLAKPEQHMSRRSNAQSSLGVGILARARGPDSYHILRSALACVSCRKVPDRTLMRRARSVPVSAVRPEAKSWPWLDVGGRANPENRVSNVAPAPPAFIKETLRGRK